VTPGDGFIGEMKMMRFMIASLLFVASLPAFAQTAAFAIVTDGVPTRTYTNANATIDLDHIREKVQVNVTGNDGTSATLVMVVPEGEEILPGEYHFARRAWLGRAPRIDFYSNGGGCNDAYGHFTIRQIQFVGVEVARLEATAVYNCIGGTSIPVAIAVTYNAPPLHYAISAPDFARTSRTYYGDTTIFSLLNSTPDKFQYTSSGQRDVWTMNFAAPTGQAQFARGIYLTEGTAKPGVVGMDIALGQNRKGEYGKLDVLTIAYRNGVLVQLSARFYFYGDAARTKLLRSGRINFWK
jgi:hypothetical protein